MKNSNKKIRRKTSSKRQKKTQRSPNHVENNKLIMKAHSYQEKEQMEQASFLYQKVLEDDAENISSLNGLGVIAMHAGMLSLATDFFISASAINPDHITINKNLGLVYTKLKCYDEAIDSYIRILNVDAYVGEIHGELARLYTLTGNMKLALKHYKTAIEICPGDPRNIHGLIRLDANSVKPEDIKLIEKYLLKHNMPLEKRCSFYFALGSYYDSCEKYDEAFANFSVANLSKYNSFDNKKHAEKVTDIINTFSAELFDDYANLKPNDSTQPVFIIGMPRSGTTLVEQILSAHTDVYAAGELNHINDISQKLDIKQGNDVIHTISLENCDIEVLKNFSKFYMNDINNLALNDNHKKPLRITDKMPINFMHLGLIALLFPNAHIIHCRRNPLDVALSCFFQNFSANHPYANNLQSIADYYQQYERLMSYWKKVLPLEIHTVDYEDMVSDTKNTSKALLKFAGLDWQDRCSEFYKSDRHINTASLIQVRRDIYQTSVNRWQNYDKHINNLKKSLSIFDHIDDATKLAIINSQNIDNIGESYSYLH